MKDLISIIIPVYNVEKYLSRCLNSVTNQTYQNLEIILVDDGSLDNSGIICDEYAKKDNRIRVIHKENGGVSSARNVGLSVYKGEYVSFIDADDYIPPNYFFALYDALLKTDSDISVLSTKLFFSDEELCFKKNDEVKIEVFDSQEYLIKLLRFNIHRGVWGGIFRREILKSIYFMEDIYVGEDTVVTFSLGLKAKRVVYTNESFYGYFVREGSAIQSNFSLKTYSAVKSLDIVSKSVLEKYPHLSSEVKASICFSYFKLLYKLLSTDDRKAYRQQEDYLTKKIKENSKGILSVADNNLKIKIISFSISKYVYYYTQKVSDFIKQKKSGRKYFV